MKKLVVLAVAMSVVCLPASAQGPRPPVPDPRPGLVGVEVSSLSDLAKVGPELKAAGVNAVVALGPLGAAMTPGLWEAQSGNLFVMLSGEAMSGASSGADGERDRLLRIYDCAWWTRGKPAFLGFLFAPRLESGLTGPEYKVEILAAEAGNGGAKQAAGLRLVEMATAGAAAPGWQWFTTEVPAADLITVYLTPEEVLGMPTQEWAEKLRAMAHAPYRDYSGVMVAFLGDGPQAQELTEPPLEQAAFAAVDAAVSGILFLRPLNDVVRRVQLGVARKLADRLGDGLKTNIGPPPTRDQVLASESSSPLLWTLKRYGEVTTSGLEPYVTPDGSTGYNVTGRALLNLAIPNRSAWVDAKRLTRFSMRMFSGVDGQGALLALSTAGEVSFVRVPIVGGWHLYTLDLTKETWESDKAAGLKWGGSTGIVQALTFTPTPAPGGQIAFDWIRLEPDATGEVKWELDKPGEVAKTEGLEGGAVTGGELKGKAAGSTVTVELALPDGRLEVKSLPFLSFAGKGLTGGTAQVEYWWSRENTEKCGGTASLRLQPNYPAQCADLSHMGFAAGTVAGEETWGGPQGRITRLRLVLPAEKGKDWALAWVRLGPNYDLRAVPRPSE